MKLSPNVTDITVMAKAAEAGGADAVSLINTLTGMKIDVERRCFALANKTGGLSGPAIKPVAVRMVYQVAGAVKVPVIGMGGIWTAEDALEFILAGATAVAVGTANFHNPYATVEVIDGILAYMQRHGVQDIRSLVGAVRCGRRRTFTVSAMRLAADAPPRDLPRKARAHMGDAVKGWTAWSSPAQVSKMMRPRSIGYRRATDARGHRRKI